MGQGHPRSVRGEEGALAEGDLGAAEGAGAVGFASLCVLYGRAAAEASGQEIPIAVQTQAGYWLALLALGAAAAVNGFVWYHGSASWREGLRGVGEGEPDRPDG